MWRWWNAKYNNGSSDSELRLKEQQARRFFSACIGLLRISWTSLTIILSVSKIYELAKLFKAENNITQKITMPMPFLLVAYKLCPTEEMKYCALHLPKTVFLIPCHVTQKHCFSFSFGVPCFYRRSLLPLCRFLYKYIFLTCLL